MADTDRIEPQYKVMMTYDLVPNQEEAYYRFALGEFVPALRNLGLYLAWAWHTAYGDYPIRQTEFVAEDLETVREALATEQFLELEADLQQFVVNYSRKVVRYKERFQF